MAIKQRILELRQALHQHNYNYYVRHQPSISDHAFDKLLQELAQLEALHPELYDPNSPTCRIGSDHDNAFETIKHKYPMLSLSNTYNRAEIEAFYQRVSDGLGGQSFEVCCELKFDGLSIALTYEHGHLAYAVTRGDGYQGDDVTANVRTIRSIPLSLQGNDYPKHFEIRGEVFMPNSSFALLNEEREANGEPLFANPRNAAAGTLKSKDSAVVASRRLDAFFYYIISEKRTYSDHYKNMLLAQSWGFKVSTATRLAHSIEEVIDFITYWDTARHALPYATDGIVLKVNNLHQQEELGNTSKSPKWAIAYKFQPDREKTRLDSVTYQVGRTGAITPVANMQPIQLSGTTVRRASLHNEDIINQLDLHIGDMVYVEKAGEIIPQIVGVETDDRTDSLGEKVRFITQCPECGTPLIRLSGEAAHYCPNTEGCAPQIKAKIEHFIARDAMNIESLGPESIEAYYAEGLIHDVADLYKLRTSHLAGADGTRIKSAEKIISNIAMSREVAFDRVLYALGIRMVGKVVAKTLASHFRSIEALQQAKLDDFTAIEGIGTAIGQSVIDYLSKPTNKLLIDKLRTAGVQLALPEPSIVAGLPQTFAGQSIVISGVFHMHTRDEYKAMIEARGGKNVGSISKKTTFILAGNNMGPSKLEKANLLNIPILSENEFLALLTT